MWRSQGKRKNKYNAKKTVVDGKVFHSIKESIRYKGLKVRQDLGLISNLQTQVKFPFYLNDKWMFTYVTDFTYNDENNKYVVEDVKGYKTAIYKLKKKIIEEHYNIKINEV